MNENKLRAAIAQNPVIVLLLGACPALAATAAVLPALTLGVTALAVMLLASLFSSLIKKLQNGDAILLNFALRSPLDLLQCSQDN